MRRLSHVDEKLGGELRKTIGKSLYRFDFKRTDELREWNVYVSH